MATIKLLTWNIENWGPTSKYKNGGKAGNANSTYLDFYISFIIYINDPDIVSFLELNQEVASTKLTTIADKYTAIYNLKKKKKIKRPWKAMITNSNQRGETYAILYRTDRSFSPLFTDGSTKYNKKKNKFIYGLTDSDASGKSLNWPLKAGQPNGGRKPFYALFKTTDQQSSSKNAVFSVIAYHASAPSTESEVGLVSISKLGVLTKTTRTTPDTIIDASLISGDFNVDYVTKQYLYNPILNLPSYPATDQKTSLKAKAPETDKNNSYAYRFNGYDNIFQKVPKTNSNTGVVMDLIKSSALYKSGDAVYEGAMYFATQKFNASIFIRDAYRDASIPPKNMLNSWKFVRGGISDHLLVLVSTEIEKS